MSREGEKQGKKQKYVIGFCECCHVRYGVLRSSLPELIFQSFSGNSMFKRFGRYLGEQIHLHSLMVMFFRAVLAVGRSLRTQPRHKQLPLEMVSSQFTLCHSPTGRLCVSCYSLFTAAVKWI
jgi:hypothetical protein